MSIKPYAILTRRENAWIEIQTDELLPGDLVSIGKSPFILGSAELTSEHTFQSAQRKIRESRATFSSSAGRAS